MSLYVLDTDHVSLFQRGHVHIRDKIQTTSPEDLAVTIITVEEQIRGRLNQVRKARTGIARIQAYARLQELIEYFSNVRVFGYDSAAETRYQNMRQQQIRIGTQDLRIASIVLSVDAVLVTRNNRDFSQISDLSIVDWSVF